ncbi:hypothetical protein VP01_14256g1 [Puccinia sorghi]|uniref:Uncharacterized protein n=1 Tax=Puccinia sorghi TaxID=27349 RepID=A0A0L6VKK5_9BASI|nr:hypothetical protein VP01_14256g1 [Puccinia sorghi]
MQIAQQPEKFFDQNQFLLAGSAYTRDWCTLPAYEGRELLDHQNLDFNCHLAQSGVRIEHATGILTGQFSSLGVDFLDVDVF